MISPFNKFSESIKFPNQKAKKIIFVIAVFLLIGLGAFGVLNQPRPTASWVKAEGVVPSLVLNAAIQQNYDRAKSEKPMEKNQIRVLKVPDMGGGNLYAIDFSTSQFCGAGGCLYAVYTQAGRSVLRLLLDPKLPKGVSLFSIDEVTRNGFSCLAIAQPTNQENTVAVARYCYEGTGFALVNSSVIKGGTR